MTRVGRHEADFAALVADAADAALARADASAIEAVFLASFAPRELCGLSDPARVVGDALARRLPALRAPIHGPFKTGGEAMFHALEFMRDARRDVLLGPCVSIRPAPPFAWVWR